MNQTLRPILSEYEPEGVRIALVDDDPAILDFLSAFLENQRFEVESFEHAEQFQAKLNSSNAHPMPFDLVLADVNLPGMNGIELLKLIKKQSPEVQLILISAHVDVKQAVLGIKEGAYDYIEKPIDLDRLTVILRNAVALSIAQRTARSANIPIRYEGVICPSASMRVVYDLIRRSATTDSNVLIFGESGVGKELVAKAIHDNSLRSTKPFVSINCSAIPENLLESELFGHVKGSFTGAHQERPGLFAEANGGTLFLDEIGDLNPLLQAKLLRAVQERKIRPVGSNRHYAIDVRLVSATNRNLSQSVKENKFREDLFYRLNVIPIHVPPLRQRKEDILVLADHFLKTVSTRMGKEKKTFSNQAMEKLLKMMFRGNVRELQNIIERCVVFSDGAQITESDIPVPAEVDGLLVELTQDTPMSRRARRSLHQVRFGKTSRQQAGRR